MNNPPEKHITIQYPAMENFVYRSCKAVGLPEEKAKLLAKVLATNDLRGVFSHGTWQIATYARLMRDGTLNNNPSLSVEKETGVSAIIDGDGGLGYFPSHKAIEVCIEKATKSGIGVTATRNHGHFGAAGIYARKPLEHDLLTFVTSGHQLNLEEGMPLYSAAGGSPMAFSAPSLTGPDLVVDFGCMHDLYASDPHRDEVAQLTPGLVLRSIGMGEICQTWGGFLTGLDLDKSEQPPAWPGANQGALFFCFRIDLFSDADVFKTKVQSYIKRIRKLTPIPPYTESYASGAVETAREEQFKQTGIPVGSDHKARLDDLAAELGIPPVLG